MGSSSSKFRKHLQNGDEYAALQLYSNSSDLRKGLDPNSSYGDNYNHDTPLHLAARHGMKSLLRIFLSELHANPNKKNARNESSVHCVCMTQHGSNFVVQQRRSECLALILLWKGAVLQDGQVERAELSSQDEKMNTPLHYAAASGLKRCVEMMVAHNSPLFTENNQKQTPCDCAEKNGNSEIALYLESKMVFSGEEEVVEEDIMEEVNIDEAYTGLRAQDLQEAKDQLLVETSDMLRIPLFTAEALLRNHEWSREMLLESWMEDAIACCEKCGVVPPAVVTAGQPAVDHTFTLSPSQLHSGVITSHDLEVVCDICACVIPRSEEPVAMSCDHQFCRVCWERYLTGKIKEGEAHNITCPGYQCCRLVPVDVIETLVSRDMARRYLQFDIKAFVESNPSIKWCPYPGCGRAVKLPDGDNPLSPSGRGTSDINNSNDMSHAADCGNGHIFCWECLGEAHKPASCDNWKLWLTKVAETKPEELSGTDEETEVAANCLWLVTNSKPCPNCKSPIQKNEGCNHMKCSKCKHDFCWVCQEAWKKHSSATGGYFRCNRYEVVKRVGEYQDMLKSDAEERSRRLQELNRFVHYYTRFKNHENSYKLEEPLLSTAKEKMMVLARAVTDPDSANLETKFVEEAVHQLLKARRVLKCSYVYGYYLDDSGYKKPIFEFMQTELEECTETLSEMVARPYLRTPRSKIIQTAHLVQRKRHEFVTAIAKGLIPPDSSPNSRKRRKKYSVEIDDDLRKALMASIQDLDPANPWIKDPSGKHTNVSALLDWPEESDESDVEMEASGAIGQMPEVTSDAAEVEQPQPAVCARAGCIRPCAHNPRTDELHAHCSMKCMKLDQSGKKSSDPASENEEGEEFFSDYEIDLLRALEMSRMHFIREMGPLHPGSGVRSPCSPNSPGQLSPLPAEHESQLSPLPPSSPLVLSEPPRGRHQRSSVSSLGTTLQPPSTSQRARHSVSMGEELGETGFDTQLQRALELSQLSLRAEERDLHLAIELSLQQTPGTDESNLTHSPQSEGVTFTFDPPNITEDQGQPYSPEYSSVVTRVPNKSVEDLASSPHSSSEYLGACAPATPGQGHSSSPRSPKSHGHCSSPRSPKHQGRCSSPRSPVRRSSSPRSLSSKNFASGNSNPFGLMKDLTMNNIHHPDTDKTSSFSQKDFSHAFNKKVLPNEQSMEQVFEPRPPVPATRPPPPPKRGSSLSNNPEVTMAGDNNSNIPPPPLPPRIDHFHRNLSHPHDYHIGLNGNQSQNREVGQGDATNRNELNPLLDRVLHSEIVDSEPIDPADIEISSEVLESLIHGAENYDPENERYDLHTEHYDYNPDHRGDAVSLEPFPRNRLSVVEIDQGENQSHTDNQDDGVFV